MCGKNIFSQKKNELLKKTKKLDLSTFDSFFFIYASSAEDLNEKLIT
jgi:hypothetical protein